MLEKKGPHFPKTIRSQADADKLKVANAESDLGYVLEAIQVTKRELNGRVPLIGFAGAPFTNFCYMVEGGGSKTFSKARGMLYGNPQLAHSILQKITDSTIRYLQAQITAGADVVQVFDSWAGILGPEQYREFSHRYIKQICEQVSGVPVTVFAKGAWFAIEHFAQLPCRTIGLDWQTDPKTARRWVGSSKTLQGNLDPAALYGSHEEVVAATKTMLDAFAGAPHIANLGHGVYPDINPDKVRTFVNTVKEYSVR
jgi:uroporphyrinogen decarboxylase